MAAAATAGPSGSSTFQTITEDHKRWLVFGIALNHVLVPSTRPFLEQEIEKEYNNLKLSHKIHIQSTHSHLPRYPRFLKYENINSNDQRLLSHGKYDYFSFDWKVTSHVDFAKLSLDNHMAKFNAFDEHCDASAVLTLLGKIPVFSKDLQDAAILVRQARNSWAHCTFTDWGEHDFEQRFIAMEDLTKKLGLASADESKILMNLNDWKTKGVLYTMNASVDSDLANLIQKHVNSLKDDVNKIVFDREEEVEAKKKMERALENVLISVKNLDERVANVESNVRKLEAMEQELTSVSVKVDENRRQMNEIKTKQDMTEISCEISSFEAEIKCLAERFDEDTRQWLIDDFDYWFSDPGDSRAYVLLGDAAVGKSVMAAVLAQRANKAGNLAAAYFCRHNDATRRNPRYLLATIAHQICDCNYQYRCIVGGKDGIQRMLANSQLRVHELFTKLLQEPLGKCNPCEKRKLVIVDALDETEYWSRDDFLNLITQRFPFLPEWLLFFITSRPEHIVDSTLETYKPCTRICGGRADTLFYEQHERDIQRFLEKRVNFSFLPCSVKDLTRNSCGSFLYAYYIVETIKNLVKSGKIDQFHNIVPRNIDEYFRLNFKRIFDKIGNALYRKLFGCALVAPPSLPVSFISFILQKENSNLLEQEVVDAISLFVLQNCDETFTFVHNLIPNWLTNKKTASRQLFIDKSTASKYFKDIVIEILGDFINKRSEKLSSVEADVLEYILGVGLLFLRDVSVNDLPSSATTFNCLTNYHFISKRIQSSKMGIYSLIEDLKFSVNNHVLDDTQRKILQDMYFALERDIYVLLESPHLLYSCLRNSTKITQQNVTIPDDVSSTWMESQIVLEQHACEFAFDMNCSALSPDEQLIAGGKGRCIFLFDARSFKKILGPIEVTDKRNITHLEFSPDGSFVFFGRLDKWFSMHQKCVVEKNQLIANSTFYEWGTFFDGHFILVKGNPVKKHNLACQFILFTKWAMVELGQVQDDLHFQVDLDLPVYRHRGHNKYHAKYFLKFLSILERMYLDNGLHPQFIELCEDHFYFRDTPCSNCLELENKQQHLTLALVRDRITELYPDMFEYQAWNIQSGKSLLEEIFSQTVHINPFFYLCHFYHILSLHGCESLGLDIFSNPSATGKMAIVMAISCLSQVSPEKREIYRLMFELLCRESPNGVLNLSCLVGNTSVKLYNHVSKSNILSEDGKWLAMYYHGNDKVRLFETKDGFFADNHKFCIENKVEQCAFTKCSSLFLYTTKSPGLLMHALSLQTGTTLLSVSGLNPVYCNPEREVGYVFRAAEKERVVLLKDLPWSFSRFCLHNCKLLKRSLNLMFTSTDTIMCVWSDATYWSWKTKDGGWFLNSDGMSSLTHSSIKEAHLEKCVFSQDGKLIATHQGFDIFLFEGGKFVCSVFREKSAYSVPFLTFSADATLLLCCIQKSNDTHSFYVWNVQTKVMSEPFQLLHTPFVDCCCFSPDNTKLIFCDKSVVEILEYPMRTTSSQKTLGLNVPSKEFDKCTHCTVSSDNELLACCIVDKILIYLLNHSTQQQLPNSHLGRIEFCQFLKRNRYLISYGVDGAVFLFDLLEWKTASYVSIAHGQDSIVSMAVSPEEDKVVCLKSSKEPISTIRLYGLKSSESSNVLSRECQGQQWEQQASTVQGISAAKRTFAHAFDEKKAISSSSSDYSEDSDVELYEEASDNSVNSASEDELDKVTSLF